MELNYWIRVALAMAAMYLTFKVFMSRENFHALNRTTILLSVAASFVLPLLKLPAFIITDNSGDVTPDATVGLGGIVAEFAGETESFSVWNYVPYIFAAGAAVFFLRFLVSTVSIAVKAVAGEKITLKTGVKLIISEAVKSPVSWLRYIFMNRRDLGENRREILVHETAHIRYGHSIDLIFMDLACCLQWFNPAVWLFRKELCAVHEFQADKAVLAEGFNEKEYQTLLIKKAAGRKWSSVASSLNHSNLKLRFTMMSNQRKSAAATFKALFPVAVAALCAFTLSDCNSEKETLQGSEVVKTTNDDGQETVNTTLKKSGQSNDNVFMVVEQMPEYPGGEAEMRKFIAENVQYPEDAKFSGASGTAYIKFVVDKNGKVTLPEIIKSSGTESIDNEALRVIKMLPDFEPGMQRGQAVDVQLTVPIKFAME
ncbi:MAG: M56 family metallopeptidase [Bacteroidales bacterium]|nr:M56 family metallopeptidase [Bacteroidales bacterium]